MKFTLLGCGTSTGVPMPGCACRVCSSTNPRNYRDRTAALITLPSGATILIDAGPDLRQQAIKNQITSVQAVIFTHAHSDHILGTDDLRSFNFSSKKRIDCYGSAETLAGLRATFSYIFAPDGQYQGGALPQLNLREFSNERSFSLLGTTVDPFPLIHGTTITTGLRIANLGYATDFKQLTPRAAEVLRGVRYLFIDGLREESHPTHNSISEAIAAAKQLGVEQAYIVHMAHSIDYAEVSGQLPPGISLGFDGLTLDFG